MSISLPFVRVLNEWGVKKDCSSFDNLYFPLEGVNLEIYVPKATVRKLLPSIIHVGLVGRSGRFFPGDKNDHIRKETQQKTKAKKTFFAGFCFVLFFAYFSFNPCLRGGGCNPPYIFFPGRSKTLK